MYLVYGDLDSDNPNYHGYIATLAADGIIIGRSEAYFTTSLLHETGHAVDSNLVSPDAPRRGTGTAFSSTSTWCAAAVSAYGASSYVEDFEFADAGRAVLLGTVYPGPRRPARLRAQQPQPDADHAPARHLQGGRGAVLYPRRKL